MKFGSAVLSVDEMQNGYLLELQMENPIGDVATSVPGARWLIITIPDTLIDTTFVGAYRSPEVDSTEVRRFRTATQFAVRMTKPISSAEVIPGPERRRILISVFY